MGCKGHDEDGGDQHNAQEYFGNERPVRHEPEGQTLLAQMCDYCRTAPLASAMSFELTPVHRALRMTRTYLLLADSGEAAQAFRFDGARCSGGMSPRARSLAG